MTGRGGERTIARK